MKMERKRTLIIRIKWQLFKFLFTYKEKYLDNLTVKRKYSKQEGQKKSMTNIPKEYV